MNEFYGWGRTNRSISIKSSIDDEIYNKARGALTVGKHKSYGDSSLNSGGQLIELDDLHSFNIDVERQIVICSAGVTVQTLVNETLQYGLYPYVVPGTAQITLGGAFASDIHGKSHQVDLTFSNHVNSINLKTADGSTRTIDREGPEANVFWATAGGMGLTGSIVSLSMNLRKVDSSYIVSKNTRFADFDNLLNEMSKQDLDYPYSVAWLDLSGKFEGRGILTQGRHANLGDLPQKHKEVQCKSTFVGKTLIPKIYPTFLTNARSIKVFNSFWFQKPLKQGIQDIHTFMHPLDGLPNWNLMYGKKGLVQYQFVVPFHEVKFIKLLMSELQKINANSLVGVIKNFGMQSAGHLSFPQLGWTFSVDLPAGIENLSFTLDMLDEKLVEAGGRIYLTKDSRMNSRYLEFMYPRIHEWRKIRDELDPKKIWKSDQSRRLQIC